RLNDSKMRFLRLRNRRGGRLGEGGYLSPRYRNAEKTNRALETRKREAEKIAGRDKSFGSMGIEKSVWRSINMKRCMTCVWAHRHINRGKVVLVVCPFARCVKRYGWAAREK